MTAPGTVARISIAPVKGLGLVHPDSVGLTVHGVPGDRRYAMLSENGSLANGKKLGPLVAVIPSFGEDPESLVLRLPDGRVVGGEVVLGGPVVGVFYGERREGRIVEGPYADALSELAGVRLRLVRMPDGGGVDRTGDGAVTLQSSAALAALAEQAGVTEPVDGRRFRMTFTLDGVPAHEEDTWLGRDVRIGDAVVRPVGNVGRCAVTQQDPDTGLTTFDTLRHIHDARGQLPTTEPLPFGVHAEVLVPGRVSLGDAVEPV